MSTAAATAAASRAAAMAASVFGSRRRAPPIVLPEFVVDRFLFEFSPVLRPSLSFSCRQIYTLIYIRATFLQGCGRRKSKKTHAHCA